MYSELSHPLSLTGQGDPLKGTGPRPPPPRWETGSERHLAQDCPLCEEQPHGSPVHHVTHPPCYPLLLKKTHPQSSGAFCLEPSTLSFWDSQEQSPCILEDAGQRKSPCHFSPRAAGDVPRHCAGDLASLHLETHLETSLGHGSQVGTRVRPEEAAEVNPLMVLTVHCTVCT